MPRPLRVDVTDTIYHVINRRVGRSQMFFTDADYKVFETLLEDTAIVRGMRILGYCLMPNHWHLILQPSYDGHMGKTLHWLTTTHARRWREHNKTVGEGPLYQGRYKSFPVETDNHLLTLIAYVEGNPLRAKLVSKAQDWPYSSLHRRIQKKDTWLSDTIVSLPKKFEEWINTNNMENIETIRNSVNKGVPYGSDEWIFETIKKFGLQSTVNKTGRPRKY
jgi:putative transposase